MSKSKDDSAVVANQDIMTTMPISTPMLRPPPARTIEVTAKQNGRVDKMLAEIYPNVGRTRLAELFAHGDVRINGRLAKKGDFVGEGDKVDLRLEPLGRSDEAPLPDAEAAKLITVLATTSDYVVIAKPKGMPTQPLRAKELGTAASAIVHLFPECAGLGDDVRDGGLVRRLDIGTSGILIAARNENAFRELRAAFSGDSVHREYVAVVAGRLQVTECATPLAQRGDHVVSDYAEGLSAYTEFAIERTSGDLHQVRCVARSGRMHQIRAHLAICGAPLLGDTRYGGRPEPRIDGFLLHAEIVRFPWQGKTVECIAPLPAQFGEIVNS